MARHIKVGFLTYDLQEFTADCLSRIASLSPYRIKAYPIFSRVATNYVAFPYRPSTLAGRYFSVHVPGSTPEGHTTSVNWDAAWACVTENHVVVLFGIQGGTALAATLLAVLGRKRLVSVNQTLPPEWERRRRWWVRWLKSWILHRCHVHVVQTPVTALTLKEIYGIPESSCVEAPFEAGAAIFQELLAQVGESRNELRARFGWAPEECVFLFVGTLLRFKGVETIIDACARLRDEKAGFRVVFIGPEAAQPGEPSIEAYERLARKKGFENLAIFLGRHSLAEVAAAYLAADALLLPTQKDCWPKVLVEAALAGLPLVTTSACGAADSLVRDGETGFVVPPDDPAALAAVMRKLLDSDLRQSLGAKAREFVFGFCNPHEEAAGYVLAIEKTLVA